MAEGSSPSGENNSLNEEKDEEWALISYDNTKNDFFISIVTVEIPERLKILITGQVGIGKTALLNAIFQSGGEITAVTKTDIKYNHQLSGADVTVYDIPSLNDPKVKDETVLEEMARVTEEEVDLIMLCFNMRGRVTRADVEIIKKLTKTFDSKAQAQTGSSIWENTLCILTFANEVLPPSSDEHIDTKQYFNDVLHGFEMTIRSCIQEHAKISRSKTQKIPIIPAGSAKEPVLQSTGINWIESLKASALERVKEAGRPALLKISPSLQVTQEGDDANWSSYMWSILGGAYQYVASFW